MSALFNSKKYVDLAKAATLSNLDNFQPLCLDKRSLITLTFSPWLPRLPSEIPRHRVFLGTRSPFLKACSFLLK